MSLQWYTSLATFSYCYPCSAFYHTGTIFLFRVCNLERVAIEVLETDRERVSWVLYLAVTNANRLVADAVAVHE